MTMRERRSVYIELRASPRGFDVHLAGKGHSTKYPLPASAIQRYAARGVIIYRLIDGRAIEQSATDLISIYGLR